MDLSASQHRRMDFNNEPCGLVKVQLAATDVGFEGNVIPPVEYKGGEYWVYMTKGSQELRIKHLAAVPAFVPCHVRFADLNIKSVQSLLTYDLTLLLPASTGALGRQQVSQAPAPSAVSASVAASSFPSNIDATKETITINGVSFNMVRVEGGTFMMGATAEQQTDANSNESPVHQVALSTFYIGETEVTQQLWRAVMGKDRLSGKRKFYNKGLQRPVDSASDYDCNLFVNQLCALTGLNFRLPTEAEWEYAARGGNKSRGYIYSGSNQIDDVAWFSGNSKEETHDVKSKQCNELGLYDMSGNVEELCQDYYTDYSDTSQTNPVGKATGITYKDKRILRGGNYNSVAKGCRNSRRFAQIPGVVSSNQGLRVVMDK